MLSLGGRPADGAWEEAGGVGWIVVLGQPREGAFEVESSELELACSAAALDVSLLEEEEEEDASELLGT